MRHAGVQSPSGALRCLPPRPAGSFFCEGFACSPSCGGRRMSDTAANGGSRVPGGAGAAVRALASPFPAIPCYRLACDASLVRDVLPSFGRTVLGPFGAVRHSLLEPAGPLRSFSLRCFRNSRWNYEFGRRSGLGEARGWRGSPRRGRSQRAPPTVRPLSAR